jgi:hypothetical protein
MTAQCLASPGPHKQNLELLNDVIDPKIFHVGFMLGTVEQVNDMHSRLTAGGFQPEEAREEHGRFTFYFKAPGGFVIEVNSLVQHPSAELRNSISPNNP